MAKVKRLKGTDVFDFGSDMEGVLTSPLTRTKVNAAMYRGGDRIPLEYVLSVWTAIRVLSRPAGPRTSVLNALLTFLRDNMCRSMVPRECAPLIQEVVLSSTPGLGRDAAGILWDMGADDARPGDSPTMMPLISAGEGGLNIEDVAKRGVDSSMMLSSHKVMLSTIVACLLPTEEWRALLVNHGDAVSSERLGAVRKELLGLLTKGERTLYSRRVNGGGMTACELQGRGSGVIALQGELPKAIEGFSWSITLTEAVEGTLANVIGGILLRGYSAVMRWLLSERWRWEDSGTLKRIREVAEVHRLSKEEMHVMVLTMLWDSSSGWLLAKGAVPACYSKGCAGPMSKSKDGEAPARESGSGKGASYTRRAHTLLLTYLSDVLWTARASSAGPRGSHSLTEAMGMDSIYFAKGKGSLISKGVVAPINFEPEAPGGGHRREVGIVASVMSYLSGVTPAQPGGYSSSISSMVPTEGAIPLELHGLSGQRQEVLLSTLRRGMSLAGKGTHILLHGLPGAGKTELAKSLARHLGGNLCQPATGFDLAGIDDIPQVSPMERLRRLRTMSLNCLQGDIILVDEADRTLNCGTEVSMSSVHNGGQVPKELLNEFMDTAHGSYIWIVNATWWIPPSTMRRFDYVLKASLPDQTSRGSLASTIANRVGLSCPEVQARLMDVALEYPLTPAGIQKIARVLVEDPTAGKGVLEEVAESHLNSSEHSVGWRRERVTSGPGGSSYDPLFVNVSEGSYSLAELEARARRFLSMPAERKKAVGLQNLNVLLYGPPGTGKTEWARHLAGVLKRPLEEISATSLMDKYVGGTEEKIRAAFSAAEGREAVLLIDEADAVLGSRESAERSWEVSQVEQFLYSMENYKGILLCTTNFEDHLDKALLRRFYASLRFGYMKADVVPSIMERSLRSLGIEEPVSDCSLGALRGLSLTPADFGKACRVLALAEEVTQEALVATITGAARSREGTRKLGL